MADLFWLTPKQMKRIERYFRSRAACPEWMTEE